MTTTRSALTAALLLASASCAAANVWEFTPPGGILDVWYPPTPGVYRFTLYGAHGGAGVVGLNFGGRGALISGTIALNTTENFAVLHSIGEPGVSGTSANGFRSGGGGATAVVIIDDFGDYRPFIIAGGGGGGSGAPDVNGQYGQITTSGGASCTAAGGTDGSGGGSANPDVGGGGGMYTDGAGGLRAGLALINGGFGGIASGITVGGLGGGAAAGPGFWGAGGGGYSGGAGSCGGGDGGGGGGSFVHPAFTDVQKIEGGALLPDGIGKLRIELIAPRCFGDLNGDHAVNTLDLTSFLAGFGTAVPRGVGADFDINGVVNTADLVVLLGAFGGPCP